MAIGCVLILLQIKESHHCPVFVEEQYSHSWDVSGIQPTALTLSDRRMDYCLGSVSSIQRRRDL